MLRASDLSRVNHLPDAAISQNSLRARSSRFPCHHPTLSTLAAFAVMLKLREECLPASNFAEQTTVTHFPDQKKALLIYQPKISKKNMTLVRILLRCSCLGIPPRSISLSSISLRHTYRFPFKENLHPSIVTSQNRRPIGEVISKVPQRNFTRS
jgi:hypothetical protein